VILKDIENFNNDFYFIQFKYIVAICKNNVIAKTRRGDRLNKNFSPKHSVTICSLIIYNPGFSMKSLNVLYLLPDRKSHWIFRLIW